MKFTKVVSEYCSLRTRHIDKAYDICYAIRLSLTGKKTIINRVMKRDNNKPVAESGLQTNHLLVIFKTLGDTTWRMFVPVIVGVLVGLWLDSSYGWKYGAVIGAVLGLILAAVLVWRQYVSVTKGGKS